jgi:hypothetical protein
MTRDQFERLPAGAVVIQQMTGRHYQVVRYDRRTGMLHVRRLPGREEAQLNSCYSLAVQGEVSE